MYKKLALVSLLLFASPALAATCYPPVDNRPVCQSPSNSSDYRYTPDAYAGLQTAYQSCLKAQTDYDQRLFVYKDCAAKAATENVYQECSIRSNESTTYVWSDGTQTCRAHCTSGYYMTVGGTCKLQSVSAKVPVETPAAAPTAVPTVPVAPAPVAVPTPVVQMPQKTILDEVPFFKVKKEEPVVSQAKIEATATATTSVEVAAPVVRPSLLKRILHTLFGWI